MLCFGIFSSILHFHRLDRKTFRYDATNASGSLQSLKFKYADSADLSEVLTFQKVQTIAAKVKTSEIMAVSTVAYGVEGWAEYMQRFQRNVENLEDYKT